MPTHLLRLTGFAVALSIPVSIAAAQQPPRPTINGGLPSVSPDGRYIAFIAARGGAAGDVYVIRSDGTGEAQLTTTPEYEGGLAWTRDGRLKFERRGARGTPGQDSAYAFTIRPDGTDLRPLLAVEGREVVPTPDGKGVIYNAGRMMAARLARAGLDGRRTAWLADSGQVIFNPAFSPDGARIAFATFSEGRQLQVGVMNADGSGRRILTTFTAADGSPQWPAWSRDGTRLAIQSGVYSRDNPAANTAHIWIIDVASGRATRLGTHERPWLDETPSYFPDGRIAFQSDRTGRMEIWVMNGDGSGARQLTK